MEILECIEGYYEVQDAEFDTSYRWCPGCTLVECDCGEMVTLTESETTCVWCGVDHASTIREKLDTQRPEGVAAHSWRYAAAREAAGVS